MRYVVSKDQKAVAADLKPIYQSATLTGAEQKLADFADKWGGKYPPVVESWPVRQSGRNWTHLTRFFGYPKAIRKVVYTTNPVESFHRQVRCETKSKGAFWSETDLLKLLYLTTQRIAQGWRLPLQNWAATLQQLTILFGERVKNYITI